MVRFRRKGKQRNDCRPTNYAAQVVEYECAQELIRVPITSLFFVCLMVVFYKVVNQLGFELYDEEV